LKVDKKATEIQTTLIIKVNFAEQKALFFLILQNTVLSLQKVRKIMSESGFFRIT